MITAVDTNVLLDIFGDDPRYRDGSLRAVRRSVGEGALIACEVVWAEVLAATPDPAVGEAALVRVPVRYVATDEEAARRAAAAWGEYRRRGGPRTRIIPDFLIGAHAIVHADRLLTRDRGFYRTAFADLTILDPSVA